MMLSILTAALISALGGLCILAGLAMYVIPWAVRTWEQHRDPDGAHALARKNRREQAQ